MTTTRERTRITESRPQSTVFRLVYILFVLAIVVLEFPGGAELKRSPDPGIDTKDLVIQAVRDGGPNEGKNLLPGDQIFSVAGEQIRNRIHYLSILAANQSYATMTYVVLRDGQQLSVEVEFYRIPHRRLAQHLSSLLLALSFLLVGTWVYLRRPDLLGSLFAVNCAILAYFLTHRPSTSHPMLQLWGELVHDAVMLLFPAVYLHFFLVFPGRGFGRLPSKRPWRLVALYAVPAALYIVIGIIVVARFNLRPTDPGLMAIVMTASILYFGTYIIASLVLFVRSYRSSPRAQKQKLRVVTAGTLAGIVPFAATLVIRQVTRGENYYLELASVLCLGFVPATFAYAILKHGAIELNHVVRRGLVYAVLTGGMIAIYYVAVASIGSFVVRELNIAPYIFMPFAVLVLAITFSPARDRVQRFIDRLFYRGEYTYRQEVFEFNRQLARKLTPDEIFESFIERVNDLLKSSFVVVYVEGESKQLDLVRRVGDPPDEVPPKFPLQSFLGRYFSRYMTPLLVEFLDPSWERPNLDADSKRVLKIPGLSVCVPVVAHDHFLSLILLGEKRSGLLYSRTDTELLATFSEQLALVLQNAELLQSSIEKERLENEVMLARDIQLSLLPASPPDHPNIDIHGKMVSSFEVGGDYFDYFFIDDDRIALAIGDVSGKGIPAAMLMSSLQAVFKNLVIKDGLAPADLNTELNAFLVSRSKTEQFASFFYGVVDLRHSRFSFSNAGHCPALLVKDTYVDRLGQGGMLLGVRDSDYREGSVGVEPGDLLVLYTDGVTEQKNPGGEEYGEDRLIQFLLANKKLPICELQSALFDEVMAFGNGQQQDDITCVLCCNKAS